ncbi:MAG: phenylalanine--tRNA ligase subunit beta [Acidobacteria bacterium]|nr:phenylalanine--tRNA ligase subunit beta [Acidobacteriota bacterium]
MKISPHWLRDFVDLTPSDRQIAEDLSRAGLAVEELSGEGSSTLFEMEIGTNRPDAMNHYGIAREAAAVYDLPLKSPAGENAAAGGNSPPQTATVEIDIADPEGCARYTAQLIEDIQIRPSPPFIADRLRLIDQRLINNAADASNYTLWEIGHPTHAFDLDLLAGGKIVVRRARAGELLTTLDGVERKLYPEDLIIADQNKPVALAGVMGGYDTMITDKTRNILIESAWFDPVAVRKTAKRHGLHTDASHRFERGADFAATPLACGLVTERILASGGGRLRGTLDAIARELDQAPVVLRIAQVHRLLGTKLPTHEVLSILKRLGFELVPEPVASPEFSVRIPTWRLDVEREIDLIEEIARLYGYDNFPNTLPSVRGVMIENPNLLKQRKLRSRLLSLGYNEGLSLSFIGHQDAETFSSAPVVEIANPLSDEASLMRSSLVPGMLAMMSYNLNRGTENIRLFEVGDLYQRSNGAVWERGAICLGATLSALRQGLPQGSVLDKSNAASDIDVFRALKGDIENLLSLFEHTSLAFDNQPPDYYDPTRSARVWMDGKQVAQFGPLHPEIALARKLRQKVFIAEIFTLELYAHGLREVLYRALPKFPGVERDFSFLFPESVSFEQMEGAVHAIGLAVLQSFQPVELFRGHSVPLDHYSILLRAKFQSWERTLREDEVGEYSRNIISALQGLGGIQRA